MTPCKWNSEAHDYLTPDGDPCRHDSYGDPTHHCTAKRSCSHHIGRDENTCGRCVGDVRNDIRAVVELAALMPSEALANGVDSQAANLAGPATDVEAWSWRKIAAKQGGPWHLSLTEDDDDWHPTTVTTRWQWMVSEDYGHDRVGTLTEATAYLDRHLHRIAQDDEQDFPLLRREIRKCRQHLEAVLHNSTARPRGVPCPTCVEDGKPVVRLELEHGHFCTDEDCDRVNYATDEGDRWVCPRDRLHWWTAKAYRDYLEERSA